MQVAPFNSIGDYHLSVTVFPATPQTCSNFTSPTVPRVLDPGANKLTTSTLSIAGQPSTITDIYATVYYTHTRATDMTATLVAPNSTAVSLFTNVGVFEAGQADTMRATFDYQAPLPVYVGMDFVDMIILPEAPAALSGFNGLNPNGTWVVGKMRLVLGYEGRR